MRVLGPMWFDVSMLACQCSLIHVSDILVSILELLVDTAHYVGRDWMTRNEVSYSINVIPRQSTVNYQLVGDEKKNWCTCTALVCTIIRMTIHTFRVNCIKLTYKISTSYMTEADTLKADIMQNYRRVDKACILWRGTAMVCLDNI